MNTVVTSKAAILQSCRKIMQTEGIEAINIRNVAAECNISIGSIYNYFQNKSALIAATVESVWFDIFHLPDEHVPFTDFISSIRWAFDCMKKGNVKYPNFCTMHSMSFIGENKKNGQEIMHHSWDHMKSGFLAVLLHDPKINQDVFSVEFTPETVVDTVFSLMIASFLQNNYDSSAIVTMVSLALYR